MRILLIGPQGSGKSTQAQLLAKSLGLPKISTGEIFRKLADQNNSLGQRVKKISEAGKLIDDETTCQIVQKRLTEPGLEKGFILDGYPRNLEQVKIFDPQVDTVIYIHVSQDEVIDRMMKRGRLDDTPAAILARLEAYYKKTQPLLDYYRNLGMLKEIDGVGTIAQIQTRIFDSLKQSLMRRSGEIAGKALKQALLAIKVGVSELEVDRIAREEIYRLGGDLSYKTVPGYKHATCITVNEKVVHGIPTDRKFESGDLVSVDLAAMYKGWHTDCAWSILVRGKRKGERRKGYEEKERFLQAGQQALQDGIAQAVEGSRVGDISNAIQAKVENAGYQVVRSLVGHGVGRSLHEDPEIPGFGEKGTGPFLKSGMSLAIEVIYTKGEKDLILDNDGWTFKTADRSWGGLFEMTVMVGKKPEVLTDWRTV